MEHDVIRGAEAAGETLSHSKDRINASSVDMVKGRQNPKRTIEFQMRVCPEPFDNRPILSENVARDVVRQELRIFRQLRVVR